MWEKLGRWLFSRRGVLGIPYFLVALIFAHPRPLQWALGGILILLGEGLRVWAVAYSGPKTRSRKLEAEELATGGPYQYVRNPIYWGNFLVGFGLVVVSGALWPWLQAAFIPLFWAEYTLIVLAEEAFLEARFGDRYRRYRAAVPRFFPRLRGWEAPKTMRPRWREALKAERSTLGVVGGLLLLFALRGAIRP